MPLRPEHTAATPSPHPHSFPTLGRRPNRSPPPFSVSRAQRGVVATVELAPGSPPNTTARQRSAPPPPPACTRWIEHTMDRAALHWPLVALFALLLSCSPAVLRAPTARALCSHTRAHLDFLPPCACASQPQHTHTLTSSPVSVPRRPPRFLRTGPIALLPVGGGYANIVWSTYADHANQLMVRALLIKTWPAAPSARHTPR